ncbi:MAG TPA: type II toxin-antitoxin system RelE/ParE family toxin [Rudaea sp.]|jgi:toxin ParE1/3/4|nr:type II toxin-antitoxin system RelE/ParE family toxin [Rudaea sp.]
MHYGVVLLRAAVRDLEEIHEFVAESDSLAKADQLIHRLQKTLEALATHPERGAYPSELRALGSNEYRQVFSKPYRIIYKVIERRVVIYLIADGRRDMQSLLSRRLFES